MKSKLIFIYFIFFISFSFAQQKEVLDSLLLRLQTDRNDTSKVDLYNSISWEYRNSDLEIVHLYADSALELSEKIGYHKGKVRSHFNIGNLYYIQGDYPNTINYYLKALAILEEIGDKQGIANALMGIGNVHSAQRNLNEGIDYQMRALAIRKEIDDSLGMAASYNNLGSIYLEQKEYMKALEYHLQSLKIKQKKGKWQGLSSSYGNIGNIYQKLGNYAQALDYQLKALEIREKLNNKKGLVMSYTDIGNIYLAQKQHDKALMSHKKALEYAREVNYSVGEINALKALADTYEKMGLYQNSLECINALIVVKDSVFDVDKVAQLSKLEKEFEVEKTKKELEIVKKDKEIDKLKLNEQDQKIRKQQVYGVLSGLVLILLGGVAYSLYKRNQLKQLANEKLAEKNEKILKQSEAIFIKNQQITDSIEYAKTLQDAILPSGSILKRNFNDYFIYYKPRDIVSGDFYWIHEDDESVYLAVVDCTGHGVPGAFVSMLANNLLNEIVINRGVTNPGEVLNDLNKGVIKVFARNETNPNPNDGMDMSFCRIEKTTKKMSFSGARNKILIIKQDKSLVELKTDDYSIGGVADIAYMFENQNIILSKGDKMYLFTDGYKDQFGGEKGKKLKYQKFVELLLKIESENFNVQNKKLDEFIVNWKNMGRQKFEQVDDICIVGIKL